MLTQNKLQYKIWMEWVLEATYGMFNANHNASNIM